MSCVYVKQNIHSFKPAVVKRRENFKTYVMEKFHKGFIIEIFSYAFIICISMQQQLVSGNPYLKLICNAGGIYLEVIQTERQKVISKEK